MSQPAVDISNKYDLDRVFASFLQSTDEKEQMIVGMKYIFSKLKQHDYWDKKTNIKVLDIGCGSGLTTEKIFKMINSIFPKLAFTVNAIDNNLKQLSGYVDRFLIYNNVQVMPKHLDIFLNKIPAQDVDLVLISHTLYYTQLSQLLSIMLSIYNLVAMNGVAIISSLANNSDFTTIQKKFDCYAASSCEIKPVSVTLDDISELIENNQQLASSSITKPYDAYVYFPQIPGGFEKFKKWQFNGYQKIAPNLESQLTLDLFEFMLQGDFNGLRKAQKLELFFETIEEMFENNGLDAEGRNRIRTNGKNIFILGRNISQLR